ncbi:ribosome maturation factor RimM [Paucidesulfovibrio longus]|uniref:ribosome maturation factor RimM n=1 Tax=Paucidesulfovibrio longus TaxID=889 RepID=UPI0003B5851C|nr:ribosome maturation factor RimM [Paucidesulfovibrio longus]
MTDPTAADRELVLVGKVIKPHGIRGEICVESYADSPALFFGLDAVLLGTGRGKPTRFEIRAVREHKDRLLLTFAGVADRNRAEELRGRDVYVREGELPELDDDEYYLRDLLGMDVLLEDGSRLGVLENFLETSGQIVWSIRHDSGKEILLPAVREFLVDLDEDAGVVTVAPPEGLVEMYLAFDGERKGKS